MIKWHEHLEYCIKQATRVLNGEKSPYIEPVYLDMHHDELKRFIKEYTEELNRIKEKNSLND